jgi:hypothetical protein
MKEWVIPRSPMVADGTIFSDRSRSRRVGRLRVMFIYPSLPRTIAAFEIGICVGMGVPIVPIRDITFSATDGSGHGQLGLLNDFGCIDFRNSPHGWNAASWLSMGH